jgi:Flp pilus assembly protein TadG
MMEVVYDAWRRLKRDQRGITLVEFAIISGPLILILMALGDLGYSSYLRAVTQGVLDRAARAASVGTMNADQVKTYIETQMQAIAPKNAPPPVVSTQSYYKFSRVGKPERIVSDTPPLGSYNSGDCYEDANNNGKYDLDRGAVGLGSADDTVLYSVTLNAPRLFPMAKILGWSSTQSFTATTIIRNQPWANQTDEVAVVRCA